MDMDTGYNKTRSGYDDTAKPKKIGHRYVGDTAM